MSKPFKFEVFESGKVLPHVQDDALDFSSLEETRLEAFEQGYKAGWDDSLSSHVSDQERVSSDFARNLNELAFTYHEVRATILKSLEPLLREMVAKVLPKMAKSAIGPLVADQIIEMAGTQSSIPVELVVGPMNRQALEKLAAGQDSLPLKIIEEESLGDGQVYIRIGEAETQVDLDGLLDGFSSALDGFFETEDKETNYG
ncbi:hypothetical protein [Falsihalocynthiibacter arcticus]|uniref:Flagellar biosynthesis protein n=1 Tax=Falsihalocynthiibacter arcticus TaxID=1579316 RepID=A0A126UYG5_9RHOB|nr:hypothetical protein [Falsihalocynthiibacter arcticus]AML51108.1 hypothetical protein RC74_07350 [Falsihalocynthiibacter arcticus]